MKSSRLATMGLAGVFLCSTALAHADTDSDRIKKLEDQLKILQEQIQKLKDQEAARDKEKVASLTRPIGQKPDGTATTPAAAPGLKCRIA